jgi:hypothetical protein
MAPITKRPSRHLLPIPSVIFKSRSKPNMQASSTLHHVGEQPDEDLTALPFPATTTAIANNHEKPKKSLWRRFLGKLKKHKRSGDTRRPQDRTPTPPPFTISEPTDFRHILSGTHGGIGTNEDFVRAFGLEACARFQVGPYTVRTSESEWTDIE